MLTCAALKDKIYRVLRDPSYVLFADNVVYDAIVAAHAAILPWAPKRSEITLTSGSSPNTQTEFALPSDCYQIEAVQRVEDGLYLERALLEAGSVRNVTRVTSIDWIEYPFGTLSLSDEVNEDDTIIVHYHGTWDPPANIALATTEVPDFLIPGIVFYAGYYCLISASVGAAQIGQFDTKVDSGQPEHNPLQQSCIFLYKCFLDAMNMLPTYRKIA